MNYNNYNNYYTPQAMVYTQNNSGYNMTMANSYPNIYTNYQTNFQNNNTPNMFANKTYPNYYNMNNNFNTMSNGFNTMNNNFNTMSNGFNNGYQNQTNNYGMTMNYPNLNNYQYQNAFYNRTALYPNMKSIAQYNNMMNYKPLIQKDSTSVISVNGTYQNMVPKFYQTKNDNEILKDILVYRQKIERIADIDRNQAIENYYATSFKMLNEMLNGTYNTVMLNKDELLKLSDIIGKGYIKYKELKEFENSQMCKNSKEAEWDNWFDINRNKSKIVQIYVFLKFLQESGDLGKNYNFLNAVKNIKSMENFGEVFEFNINSIKDKNKIYMLNKAIAKEIKTKDINDMRQRLYEDEYSNTQSNIKYDQENNATTGPKSDEELIEDIIKHRIQVEGTVNDCTTTIAELKTVINTYYEECIGILKELLNNNSSVALNKFEIQKLNEIVLDGYRKHTQSNYSGTDYLRHLKKNISNIYVFLRILKESTDLGRNNFFLEAIKSIQSTNDFGEKFLIHMCEIGYKNEPGTEKTLILNEAIEDEITNQNLKNIQNKIHIKEDDELSQKIFEERNRIENLSNNTKEQQTKIYYDNCKALLYDIYSNPYNNTLSKDEVCLYKEVLDNNYNTYCSGYGYNANFKKNLENSFMKMYVLLTFINKSNYFGKDQRIIKEVKKMNNGTIETNNKDEIVKNLPQDEQTILIRSLWRFS